MIPAEVKSFTSLDVSFEALLELASGIGFAGSSADPDAPGVVDGLSGSLEMPDIWKIGSQTLYFPNTEIEFFLL